MREIRELLAQRPDIDADDIAELLANFPDAALVQALGIRITAGSDEAMRALKELSQQYLS